MQIISLSSTIFTFFFISLIISWKLTLIMSFSGLIIFPILIPFINNVTSIGDNIAKEEEILASWCSEMLVGVKYMKISGGESFVRQRFEVINARHESCTSKSFFYGCVVTSIYQGLTILLLVISLAISIKILNEPIVSVLMVLGLFYRLYPKYTNLNNNLYKLKLNLSGLKYICSILEKMYIYQERKLVPKNVTVRQRLNFENVTVKYNEKFVLKNFSLNVAPGSFVAFVGESGAGKTTALDVLMGLIELNGGEILFDTFKRSELSMKDIRNVVGYVSQDTVLFNGTILENIVWGEDSYLESEVVDALKLANAYDFVMDFELGLLHKVGDRGVKLSGGQRQRIGIARVLYQKRQVLILDEPTSALDAVSEQLILNTLNDIKGKVTIIMVAHRLSTVRDADYIYVFDSGSVIEHGTWGDLASSDTLFSEYYKTQSLSC